MSSGPALQVRTCGTNNSVNVNRIKTKTFTTSLWLQDYRKVVPNIAAKHLEPPKFFGSCYRVSNSDYSCFCSNLALQHLKCIVASNNFRKCQHIFAAKLWEPPKSFGSCYRASKSDYSYFSLRFSFPSSQINHCAECFQKTLAHFCCKAFGASKNFWEPQQSKLI